MVVLLGCALLGAPWLKCFQWEDGTAWRSQSTRLGYKLLAPLVIIYVSANAFVLVLSFYPPDSKGTQDRRVQILSALVGPVAGHCVLLFGILWWAWDRHLLPAIGYHFSTQETTIYSSRWRVEIIEVHFYVSWLPVLLFRPSWLISS